MYKMYHGYEFVVAKEGWENTGNIDVTLDNLMKNRQESAHFCVVVSAMRKEWEFNTTQILEGIGQKIARWETDISWDIMRLWDFHKSLVQDNFSGNSTLKNKLFEYIEAAFVELSTLVHLAKEEYIPSLENDYSIQVGDRLVSLKWFGEVFCADFYQRLLALHNISVNIPNISSAPQNIQIGEDSFESLLDFFRHSVRKQILRPQNINNGLTILPGYIGGIEWGIDASIWSGYSDATAAFTAVSLQEYIWNNKKVLLEILKSVEGIMSADPRILEHPETAKLISRISFLIAKEIVGGRGAQAKLLNSDAMRQQVIKSWISLRLRDPKNTLSQGTMIDGVWNIEALGVEAILGRPNVAFVSISTTSMPQGFLTRVFEIVQKYKSVDIISSSETEVSFTVDMKNQNDREIIEAMRAELLEKLLWWKEDEFNKIKILYDQALVFCIGQNMKDKIGLFSRATSILNKNHINIELVSQAQQQRAMTFWIDGDDLKKAIRVLHREFIESE